MANEVFVGRIRSIPTHAFLSVATLGIYFFIWWTLVNHELRRHRENQGPHPAIYVVVFLLVPVIGWFVMPWISAVQLRKAQATADADKRSSPWYPALWGLVPILGWTVAGGYLQAGANRLWHGLHGTLGQLKTPVMIECPDCTTRFERALLPFGPVDVQCPRCSKSGAV